MHFCGGKSRVIFEKQDIFFDKNCAQYAYCYYSINYTYTHAFLSTTKSCWIQFFSGISNIFRLIMITLRWLND